MDFDRDKMAKRFHELRVKADTIREKITPLSDRRQKMEAEFDAAAAKIDEQITAIKAEIAPLKKEMAIISRALNGQTQLPG